MTVARARRLALYVLAVCVLYSIITFPERSGEFAQVCFRGVSEAAEGVGDLIAEPLG
ncbi:hypothetical protein [Streptomyces hoynatensis]|uniref:hypothetical protein n=1 Tax=Streptomyces hoynatensis TaxID=1141874 RepID=UPI001319C404|nr:hypothetical protein [Streptomyces hoynatensis]